MSALRKAASGLDLAPPPGETNLRAAPLAWLQNQHQWMSIAAYASLSLCWGVVGAQRLIEDAEYDVAVLAFSILGLGCVVIGVLLFAKPKHAEEEARVRPRILEGVLLTVGVVMVLLSASIVRLTDNVCGHNRFAGFHLISWKILPALLGMRTLPSCMFYIANLLIDVTLFVSLAEVDLWLVIATWIFAQLLFGYTAQQQKLLFRLREAQEHLITEKATFETLLRMGFDASFWVASDADTVQGGGEVLDEVFGCMAEGTRLSDHVPKNEIQRLRRALCGSVSLDQPVRLLHTTLLRRTPGDEAQAFTTHLPVDLYIVDRRVGLPIKEAELQLLGVAAASRDNSGRLSPKLSRSQSRLFQQGTDGTFFCAIRFLGHNDRHSSSSNKEMSTSTGSEIAFGSGMGSWTSFAHEKTISFVGSSPFGHQISTYQPFDGMQSMTETTKHNLPTIQDDNGEWDSTSCVAVGVGTYRKVREIGRGSQGTVWEVVSSTGESAAMKVTNLSANLPGARTLQSRLMQARLRQVNREVRILKSLGWAENVVVSLRECMLSSDFTNAYMVMEFMPHNLAAVLRERDNRGEGAPPIQQVKKWVVQLGAGIAAIHSVGAIHRDIKPSNILMTAGAADCKIGDFGVGRWAQDHDHGGHVVQLRTDASAVNHKASAFSYAASVATDRTGFTIGIGSWEYAAPEIMQSGAYGQAVDLYALGCVLFEMLTLEQAWDLGDEGGGGGRNEPPIERSRKAAERVRKVFAEMEVEEVSTDEEPSAGEKLANWSEHQAVRSVCERLLTPSPSDRPSAMQVLEHKDFLANTHQLVTSHPSLLRLFKISL